MIDVQLVNELVKSLDTLYPLAHNNINTVIVSALSIVFMPIITLIMVSEYRTKFPLIINVMLIIPIILIINSAGVAEEYSNTEDILNTELIHAYDDQIKTAACDDLRIHIVDVLENDHVKYIEDKSEWVQEIYYHKCEIPLRDEVMKLK